MYKFAKELSYGLSNRHVGEVNMSITQAIRQFFGLSNRHVGEVKLKLKFELLKRVYEIKPKKFMEDRRL